MEELKYSNQVSIKKKLNETSFIELEELVKICNKNDNTELMFHLDAQKEDITKFLFYHEEKLIGYFGMVPSYVKGEAMVWGMILPSHRTEETFLHIFESVRDKCKENNTDKLKVINERNADSFREFVTSIGGKLLYSSYEMNFNIEYYEEKKDDIKDFTLKKASLDDLEDMISIGMDAFETTEEEERSYNERNLKDSKLSNYIGRINNTPVGIISSRIEDGEVSIADLAVLRSYRRRGIGRAILSKTIAYLLNQGIEKFKLGVETENKNALSLYEDSGFRIVKASDCYELKI
ncbi:GNAT family N-acetyltransferase [Oceanirhabdus sp. W0125-5]|uniref:GNAT family N-acetyltransferase n=1 Tax=Oceanirhabdus sp. W0125-5 TaxID=2999116 RepID=UPI0022F30208|nr:GNAT family N-acetyltransferase [Oceanirhabdus sp. W0125-5]WBW98258.1 GNAT family N-acetyltransferase [Oceanirhabdus sp. W0125-5]